MKKIILSSAIVAIIVLSGCAAIKPTINLTTSSTALSTQLTTTMTQTSTAIATPTTTITKMPPSVSTTNNNLTALITFDRGSGIGIYQYSVFNTSQVNWYGVKFVLHWNNVDWTVTRADYEMNNAPPGLLILFSDFLNPQGVSMTVNDLKTNIPNQSAQYKLFAKTSPNGAWETVQIR